MIVVDVNLKDNPYKIYLEAGILNKIASYLNLNRKTLIITDTNIPTEYIENLKSQIKDSYTLILNPGEETKSIEGFSICHKFLLDNNFGRNDLIIALGGGVIGDLAGFVASTFKRGLDFVNIPTTTLSQIDSSVGGKTAINLEGVKNVVGTFHQPIAVFIDFDLTKSLTERHFNNGLIEALKAGLIRDKTLFEEFEKTELDIEQIIYKAIVIKAQIVEIDEKESGLRKILNFGHTIGHGIESYYHNSGVYHGEAVGIGMIKILKNQEIKARVMKILTKLKIDYNIKYDAEAVYNFILNDKKVNNDQLEIITVSTIGTANIEKIKMKGIKEYL